MYSFCGPFTLKRYSNNGEWYQDTIKTEIEHIQDSLVSVISPDTYKNNLDTFLETPEKWSSRKETVLEPGKLYRLFDKNVYRLEKIISNENVNINILSIAIKDEDSDKKSLTEAECEQFGITYKDDLVPISYSTKLYPYSPIEEQYDENNLLTYPGNNDGIINYMILKLGGFSRTNQTNIIRTPEGKFIDIELFLISLGISYKINIKGVHNTEGRKKDEDVEFQVISKSFKGSERINEGEICDVEGNIYVILNLKKDGVGISPYALDGLTPGKLFDISWDTSFSNKSKEPSTKNCTGPFEYVFNIFNRTGNNSYWRTIKNGLYVPLIDQEDYGRCDNSDRIICAKLRNFARTRKNYQT
jgi:hypothetical protein